MKLHRLSYRTRNVTRLAIWGFAFALSACFPNVSTGRTPPDPTAQPPEDPLALLPPTPDLSDEIIAPVVPLVQSRLGIQGHFGVALDEMDRLLELVSTAGFSWVKNQIDWSENETPPDVYPELAHLDAFMDDAERRGLNVLLSIVKAPDWARSANDGYGPPDDYDQLYDFVTFLANRYRPRLDHIQIAFEIWNEPNTSADWAGAPISAREYVRLLAGASYSIRAQDTRYMIISAGLAPTGLNDGIIAVDDRAYLRDMYRAGVANYADAIGVHPYGWANPPWARCCGDPNLEPTHDDHPSFFFLDTIADYRAIQAEFGDSSRPLWATEFGWGTVEGLGIAVPEDAPYYAYVSERQQAEYILHAYVMAQSWDFMGPMFLWNLNVATILGYEPSQAAYSLLATLDRPRLAYIAIRDAPKVATP